MADQVFEAAQARLAELEKEIREVNDFIRLHRQMRQRLGLDAGTPTPTRAAHGEPQLPGLTQDESGTRERLRVVDNPKPSVVIDAVLDILVQRGRPMPPKELHAALCERGLVIRGAHPAKTLSTNLWRAQDRVVSVEGHGYWPKAINYPPAGYYPQGLG